MSILYEAQNIANILFIALKGRHTLTMGEALRN